MPARRSAIPAKVGLAYTCGNSSCGWCSRSAVTRWATATELPPRAKKSDSGVKGAGPSTAVHRSASQRRSSGSGGASPASNGSGHGSAVRSTFPEDFIGSSSKTARVGTTPPGSRSPMSSRMRGRSSSTPFSGIR